MTETVQLILASLSWYVVATFAVLYSVGGRAGTPKWIRRIVGGLLIAGATLTIAAYSGNFRAWMLIALVTLPVSLSLGYGADTTVKKILRRGLFGLAVSSNALIFAIPLGMVSVAVFQIILGTTASIFFGVRNPFNNASKEEAVIGGLCVILIPFIV